MTSTEIKPLRDYPEFAPILAYWSYRLWYRKRDIDFNFIIKSYHERTDESALPVSRVAIEKSMPVGMASLKENDLWSRKDLNPWLASLYVEPDFRERGIAEKLINAVIGKARELNIQQIYLFLDSSELDVLERYYLKRGWKYLEDTVDNDGKDTKIFYFPLS